MVDTSVRLLPATYSLRDAHGGRKPVSVREALGQYLHSLNFVADRRNALHTAFELSHLAMLVPTVLFFWKCLSVATLAAYAGMFVVLVNFNNTVWYHRYCSHRAFSFSHPLFPRLCLWFNPLGYREEVYALVHHVHHTKADSDEDPNGPQLGWLGNYTASYFGIDTDISPEQYERLKARLAHLHMPFSSYASFQRWACIESVPHYLARWAFASSLWAGLWYLCGGVPLLMAWFAAQFSWHAIVRDFNFRGHGTRDRPGQVDGWDFDRRSLALNQRMYGYLGGEWHNNHHAFPASAKTAFLRGQFDLPFQLIRLMRAVGIIADYHDHTAQFRKRYGLDARRRRAESVEGSVPEPATEARCG